ncbi:uncharacterized protein METZ01_LOCUS147532, partial [marine metagenome]
VATDLMSGFYFTEFWNFPLTTFTDIKATIDKRTTWINMSWAGIGDFTWRVPDCEESMGVSHTR